MYGIEVIVGMNIFRLVNVKSVIMAMIESKLNTAFIYHGEIYKLNYLQY